MGLETGGVVVLMILSPLMHEATKGDDTSQPNFILPLQQMHCSVTKDEELERSTAHPETFFQMH